MPKLHNRYQHTKKTHYPDKLHESLKTNRSKYFYKNLVILEHLSFAAVRNKLALNIVEIENPEIKIPLKDLDLFPEVLIFEGNRYLKGHESNYLIEDQSLISDLNQPEQCPVFSMKGICTRKPCMSSHSKDKIRLCPLILKIRGVRYCNKRNCPFNHTPTEFNSPSCLYFNNDYCRDPHCFFTHKLDWGAKMICRPFSRTRYCEDGSNCQFKHSFDCENYYDYCKCYRAS